MIKKWIVAATVLLLSFTAGAAEKFQPYGEGMPAPWPFPWAKECPVKWSNLTGRYVMYDQFQGDDIDLKLSIVSREGLQMMRISRYARGGGMISDGITLITERQKSVRVYLRPLTTKTQPMWASLKLHFDRDYSCEMSRLVPILSLFERRDNITTEAQYRLVPARWKNRH